MSAPLHYVDGGKCEHCGAPTIRVKVQIPERWALSHYRAAFYSRCGAEDCSRSVRNYPPPDPESTYWSNRVLGARFAAVELRATRDRLAQRGIAPRTLAKVRSALKSALGAERYALAREARARAASRVRHEATYGK